ncbi:DUF1501 domain-containing protein [Jiella sp. MQZ9-1]|uniref:DUF1501 domain-containing protein n=1 Tax=Jiella flava TaxID=2816857 RepID=A0A939FY96_9HYPH|nr:DUF1501 domain-containing protein [Jiella flava]MBO0662218.1 DUF1501 domain-containing protein [Jiella flava]MCD2470951.1 DUF1501 domain-containing protein [Jiella flava]
METCSYAAVSRRKFLVGASVFASWAVMPKAGFAGTRDPRFVVVILRGALDGMAAVAPIGDPNYRALRAALALGEAGKDVLPLSDGFFALNEAMPRLHQRYLQRQALIVHAVATAYRERSHFDGQNVLETGLSGPDSTAASGWLNRVASALPAGKPIRTAASLAIGPTVPMILTGPAGTLTWAPQSFRPAGEDTAMRLASLYGETDPQLAKVLSEGLETDRMMGQGHFDVGKGEARAFRLLANGAAKLLAEPDGPRLATISYEGWDTHVKEGADHGRLAKLLTALDLSLADMATTLGRAWNDTVIAIVTEFGRTAWVNGNDGTDHGTATTAFLLGGAVKGGRVVTDWPGLRKADLQDGRDLKPTTDLRAVFKGILRDHLGLSEQVLARDIFPGSQAVKPLHDLVI